MKTTHVNEVNEIVKENLLIYTHSTVILLNAIVLYTAAVTEGRLGVKLVDMGRPRVITLPAFQWQRTVKEK